MTLNTAALAGTKIKIIRDPRVEPFLVIDDFGPEQSGKTDFAFTGPGPIYHQLYGAQNEAEGPMLRHHKSREILQSEFASDVPEGLGRKDEAKIKAFFAEQMKRAESEMRAAFKAGARTVIVDKGNEVWESIRYGHFGKLTKVPAHLYGAANQQFADYIRIAPLAKVNLIVLHEDEDEWENYLDKNGEEKRRQTGRRVRKGNEKMGYLIDVALRSFKVPKVGGGVIFKKEVVECRPRPELIGKVYENLDFLTLAMDVKPDVNPEAWL